MHSGKEIFHFEASSYPDHIKECYKSNIDPSLNIYRKRRQKMSTDGSMGPAIATVNFLSLAWTLRRRHVASRKLRVLEEEWTRRGGTELPFRKRDTFIVIAVCLLALSIGLGLDEILMGAGSDFVTDATSQAVSALGQAASSAAPELLHQATTDVVNQTAHQVAHQAHDAVADSSTAPKRPSMQSNILMTSRSTWTWLRLYPTLRELGKV